MSGFHRPIILNSPGPVADAFLHDDSFVSICIGPVGSGKTLTGLQKMLRNGAMQNGRIDRKGVTWRRARWCVLRESYPNIDKTIMPSWFKLVPEAQGKFSWKAPYTHRFVKVLRRDAETGQPIDLLDMEVEFQAIGDLSIEALMRGKEVNGFMTDEADLQPQEILEFGAGRVGRFNDLDPKLVVNQQLIFTSNMPWIGNWLYRVGIERSLGEMFDDPELVAALKGRKMLECYVQPGGRSSSAENIHNLPDGYYALQVAIGKHKPGHVARMVDNIPTPPMHGQAVYPGFRHDLHVAKSTIEWDKTRPLIIGMDQGLYAAAVFMQRDWMGRLRVLAEVVFVKKDGRNLEKVGGTAFGRAVAQKLADRFPGIQPSMIVARADPAAFPAKDTPPEAFEWILQVQAQMPKGVRIRPAKSNSPELRQESVRKAQNDNDGYLVDPSCTHLISGHLGGYHFANDNLRDGETKGHTTVADTIHTHVCDAEQYGAMEGENVINILRGKKRGDPHSKPRVRHGSGFFSSMGVG